MPPRFRYPDLAALRALLDLPSVPRRPFRTAVSRLALDDVQRALELPPPPYRDLLRRDRWLAGGQLQRWACGGADFEGARKRRDVDLYFPSPAALDAAARELLATDYELIGYVRHVRTLRELRRQRVTRNLSEEPDLPIVDGRGRLVELTTEVVARLSLAAVNLRAPGGDKVQLIATFRPTPLATIEDFDLSVCQLAADDRELSFGPWTWSDLALGRLRLARARWPDSTWRRAARYRARGFRPGPSLYAGLALRVFVHALKHLTNRPARWRTDAADH